MRKSKNVLSLFAAMITALSVLLTTGASAFAQNPRDIWYVGWEDDTYQKYIGWKGSSDFSVDTGTYYKDSRYSIKISNSENYNYGRAEKIVKLEPYTTYKFSAMVKYKDFEVAPDAESDVYGANLEVCSYSGDSLFRVSRSSASNSKEWTKLECTFTTNDEKGHEYYFRLMNGDYSAKCKGTAWFSDIKLEKAKTTNQWNVLAVIFPTVETDVDLHDRSTILQPNGDGLTHYKATLTDKEIEGVYYTTDKLKKSFAEVSGGLVNICNIDYVTATEPVTELTDYIYGDIKGYSLDINSKSVSKVVDKYISQKTYQQVILFAPLNDIDGGWWGNGGSKYKGINFCQITCDKDNAITSDKDKSFIEGLLIHEILHGVEADSKVYDPTTPDLHDNTTIYQEQYPHDRVDNNKTYYTDYMRHNLPDGRGVDPRAYYRPSGEYTLVSDDMTSGGEIDSSALPLKLTEKMVAKIADQDYTGKSVKPAVTIKDGRYTLKNGVDYTVSYENNQKIGTATATITGKGLYKGTVTAKFTIEGLRGINGASFKTNEAYTAKGLELTFDASHSGKFANLYTKDKKFVACAKLGKDGKATLSGVSEKADYIVMLCEFSDKPGDMNSDGILNAKDSLAVLKHYLDIEKGANPEFADINNDGFINAKDALIILQISLGLI